MLFAGPMSARYSPSLHQPRQYAHRRVKRQSSVSPRFVSTPPQNSDLSPSSESPTDAEENAAKMAYLTVRRSSRDHGRNNKYLHEDYNSTTLTRKFSESAIIFPHATEEPTSPKIETKPQNVPQKAAPTPVPSSSSLYTFSYLKSMFRRKATESPDAVSKPENITPKQTPEHSPRRGSVQSANISNPAHARVMGNKSKDLYM